MPRYKYNRKVEQTIPSLITVNHAMGIINCSRPIIQRLIDRNCVDACEVDTGGEKPILVITKESVLNYLERK